jgi:hypothetical protein
MRAVYFSQLVSSILGNPAYPPKDTGIHILVVAAVAGEILEVGPTHFEYLDDVDKLERWKYKHQIPYPEAHAKIRAASAAYDSFLYRNSRSLATKVVSINPDTMYSHVKPQAQPTPAQARGFSTQSTYERSTPSIYPVSEVRWNSNEAHWLSQNVDYITNFYNDSDRRTHSHRVPLSSNNDADSRRSFFGTLFSSRPTRSKALPPERASKTSSSPRLFLGSNYLLGSAPSNTKKGDVICQFWNTEVTALLRRCEGPSSSYQVVGKVYLSTGYMEGLQAVFGERIEPKNRAKTMLIEMDLRTLSRLTCQSL